MEGPHGCSSHMKHPPHYIASLRFPENHLWLVANGGLVEEASIWGVTPEQPMAFASSSACMSWVIVPGVAIKQREKLLRRNRSAVRVWESPGTPGCSLLTSPFHYPTLSAWPFWVDSSLSAGSPTDNWVCIWLPPITSLMDNVDPKEILLYQSSEK